MSCLLFPGRHHLLTNFQAEYLTLVTDGDASSLRDVNGAPLALDGPIDTVIWAVTSANHFNTRRNPLPAYRRVSAIEEFASELGVESFVYMIDDIGHKARFAEYVLKKIEVESNGRFALDPRNTVVGCSTPAVIDMYEQLGFRILPFELTDRKTERYCAETPWRLIMRIVQACREGRDWRRDESFLRKVAPASRHLFVKYDFGDLVSKLHDDALLTEDGDLTATRDYQTYMRAFDDGADRKYNLVRGLLVPGRIVDIGCCTGSIIREMSNDHTIRESDFYGIEAARPLYAECLHCKEQGAFANDNVFFYQRDFASGPIFPANSVNTFTTFSLTHEIESYHGRGMLESFMRLLFDQLASGGRWINVDVVGPPCRDEPVCMWLCPDDGENERGDLPLSDIPRDEVAEHVGRLSTFSRFLRFARDFRREEGYRLDYEQVVHDGSPLVQLRLEDACEFLSKKDYADNWQSEMHERFCFWNFDEWKAGAERAGFRVHPASHEFLNPWLVEHRYEGKVQLFQSKNGSLVPLSFPASNLVLVAEKA